MVLLYITLTPALRNCPEFSKREERKRCSTLLTEQAHQQCNILPFPYMMTQKEGESDTELSAMAGAAGSITRGH